MNVKNCDMFQTRREKENRSELGVLGVTRAHSSILTPDDLDIAPHSHYGNISHTYVGAYLAYVSRARIDMCFIF